MWVFALLIHIDVLIKRFDLTAREAEGATTSQVQLETFHLLATQMLSFSSAYSQSCVVMLHTPAVWVCVLRVCKCVCLGAKMRIWFIIQSCNTFTGNCKLDSTEARVEKMNVRIHIPRHFTDILIRNIRNRHHCTPQTELKCQWPFSMLHLLRVINNFMVTWDVWVAGLVIYFD